MTAEQGRVHVITEKGPTVADSRIIPAPEWTGFTKALNDVNRGASEVSRAAGFLDRWGINSMATIGRSVDPDGRPFGDYGIRPLKGYNAPIATDAKHPDGGAGVQITTDLARPTPPRRRVLSHA